jgi:hypothetical protein
VLEWVDPAGCHKDGLNGLGSVGFGGSENSDCKLKCCQIKNYIIDFIVNLMFGDGKFVQYTTVTWNCIFLCDSK